MMSDCSIFIVLTRPVRSRVAAATDTLGVSAFESSSSGNRLRSIRSSLSASSDIMVSACSRSQLLASRSALGFHSRFTCRNSCDSHGLSRSPPSVAEVSNRVPCISRRIRRITRLESPQMISYPFPDWTVSRTTTLDPWYPPRLP